MMRKPQQAVRPTRPTGIDVPSGSGFSGSMNMAGKNCHVEPEHKSGINNALNILDDHAEQLIAIANNLEARLLPLLRPSDPSSCSVAAPGDSPSTLAGNLSDISVQLDGVACVLVSILKRLDL